MPYVVNPFIVNLADSQVVSLFQPVWFSHSTTILGLTAETALTFLWENLPSFIAIYQRNTSSFDTWMNGSTNKVVLSVIEVNSLATMKRVVKELAMVGVASS